MELSSPVYKINMGASLSLHMGKKGVERNKMEDNAQVKQGCYCYGSTCHTELFDLFLQAAFAAAA